MRSIAYATNPRRIGVDERARRAEIDRWIDIGLDASEAHYCGGWHALSSCRRHNTLERIDVPTLMVVGAADSLLGANLKDFRSIRKAATLHVFSNCGHSPQREVADQFNAVLVDFLRVGVVTFRTIYPLLAKL
jgi:pimeloyl-ACP methyl ester carboxylesterase